MDLLHAADIVDDAANFLTTDQILPCDEGTAVAESLGTLGMNLREFAKSPLIAAAPELLKALLDCITDDESLALSCEDRRAIGYARRRIIAINEAASAAIAKAKGVQS